MCVCVCVCVCVFINICMFTLRRALQATVSDSNNHAGPQRNRLAWPHRRRGLASDGVQYAGARSSVGRRFRSVTKLRLEWHGGVFLLLQQRSKHPREMFITPKASTSHLIPLLFGRARSRPSTETSCSRSQTSTWARRSSSRC